MEPDKDVVEDELVAARDRGDAFSVGQILARRLPEVSGDELDRLLAKVTCAWASTRDIAQDIESLSELADRVESFSSQNLASAFVNALDRFDDPAHELPGYREGFRVSPSGRHRCRIRRGEAITA